MAMSPTVGVLDVEKSDRSLSQVSNLTLNSKSIQRSQSRLGAAAQISLGPKLFPEKFSNGLSLKRSRACGSKVRTGCITCKTRRVKCDEQKPDCLRCRSTSRDCEGYLPIDQGKKIRPLRRGSEIVFDIPHLPFDIPGSVRERRSFHFFCARSVPQLMGYFKSDFWSRILLQTTHLEPAVRHAAVSIGSVHEQFEAGNEIDETQASGTFALQQYNTAINHLVNAAKKQEKQTADVILMSCLLFISFEMLRANFGVAFTHVKSGLKILCQVRSKGNQLGFSACQNVSLQALESLFLRLDTQATKLNIGPHNVVLVGDDHHNQAWGRGPEKVEEFRTLEDARELLDQYWNFIIHFRKSVVAEDMIIWAPDAQDARKAYYHAKLEEWLMAMERLIERDGLNCNAKVQKAISMLRIYHAEAILMLGDTGTNHTEAVWDRYIPEFETIISLTEPLINSKSSTSPGPPSRSFTLEMGFVSALYITASKYRHPAKRRKAVSLLLNSTVQEGMTSGPVGAMYGNRVIQLEEEGLDNITDCSSIPLHKRIRVKDVLEFYPAERRGMMFYVRQRSEEDPTEEDLTECIRW